jgi:succinate dehydrogenase flavin-adding protein (antitoxin of CptAB toxin-antitoxin module)
MSELDRVRWSCRRGLLELDLVLARFLERRLEALTPAELEAFKRLLHRSDNDLWDLVAGRSQLPSGLEGQLIRELQQV